MSYLNLVFLKKIFTAESFSGSDDNYLNESLEEHKSQYTPAFCSFSDDDKDFYLLIYTVKN